MFIMKEENPEQMLTSIEKKRKEMIESGKTTGLTSCETIKCSTELDKLIYYYQIITYKNAKHQIKLA